MSNLVFSLKKKKGGVRFLKSQNEPNKNIFKENLNRFELLESGFIYLKY